MKPWKKRRCHKRLKLAAIVLMHSIVYSKNNENFELRTILKVLFFYFITELFILGLGWNSHCTHKSSFTMEAGPQKEGTEPSIWLQHHSIFA